MDLDNESYQSEKLLSSLLSMCSNLNGFFTLRIHAISKFFALNSGDFISKIKNKNVFRRLWLVLVERTSLKSNTPDLSRAVLNFSIQQITYHDMCILTHINFTYFSIKIQQIKCINTDLNFNLRGISILLGVKKIKSILIQFNNDR